MFPFSLDYDNYNNLGSYIKIIYTQVTENYSAFLQTKKEAHCFLEQFFSKVLQEIWVWEGTKNLPRWNVDFSKSEHFPASVIKRY